MNDDGLVDYPIIGFAFTSMRMGYFVEVGNRFVFEYGVKDFTTQDIETVLKKACALVDQYRAKTVCLQDIIEPNCKLGETNRSIIRTLEESIKKRKLCLKSVSKPEVWEHLKLPIQAPKKHISIAIAELYPEISHLLPAPRKLWDDEPRYMCMFIAAAMTEVQYKEVMESHCKN